MRQLGSLTSETDARRFTAYLIAQGIDAEADQNEQDWTIWVRDEDQRQAARDEFERFLQDPTDARYAHAEREGEAILRERQRKFEQARRSVVDIRGRWRSRGGMPTGPRPPVTSTLVVLSIVVTLLGWFGNVTERSLGGEVYSTLMFADPGDYRATRDISVSLRHGHVWRLFTPMFLHFNVAHIVFNMLMFYQFGKQIEWLRGPVRMGLLVLILSAAANLAQAYLPGLAPGSAGGGVLFGGMSGVVYGLFGYIWMRRRTQPASGFVLEPSTVVILLLWFVLCFVGVIPNVANYAHAGGLAAGMVIGLVPWIRGRAYG